MNIGSAILLVLCAVSLIYVLASGVGQALWLAISGFNLRRHVRTRRFSDHRRYLDSENMLPLSVLMPMSGREDAVSSLERALDLDFPEYEVIAVCDGNRGGILQQLEETFGLIRLPRPIRIQLEAGMVRAVYRSPRFPGLTVLDKPDTGEADALNAGINISRYPLFMAIRPDCIPHRDALLRITLPFVKDHRIIAATTIPRLEPGAHEKSGPLELLRAGEALRNTVASGSYSGRAGLLILSPGAVGVFRKQAVVSAGGYSPSGAGDTGELALQLYESYAPQKEPHEVRFIPEALVKRRLSPATDTWRKGLVQYQSRLVRALKLHRNMLYNPAFGSVGIVKLPWIWLFEVIGPLIVLLGYVLVPLSFGLGLVSLDFLLGYFALSVLFGVLVSLGALLLDFYSVEDQEALRQFPPRFILAVLSNFGYRQLTNFLRILGTLATLKPRPNNQKALQELQES